VAGIQKEAKGAECHVIGKGGTGWGVWLKGHRWWILAEFVRGCLSKLVITTAAVAFDLL
jgi:hypothetical protein